MSTELFNDDLYNHVLIEPAENGSNTLRVVSGYVSPAMVVFHLEDLKDRKLDCRIEVLCGVMNGQVKSEDHELFVDLENEYNNFKCSYSKDPIHAKVYAWNQDEHPKMYYIGSANYTKNGLLRKQQKEVMVQINSDDGVNFYSDMLDSSMRCTAEKLEITKHIKLTAKSKKLQAQDILGRNEVLRLTARPDPLQTRPDLSLLKKVKVKHLSLLDKKGGIHQRAGLNWGQREGRNHNQAYIPVPQEVRNSNFFPERGHVFKVITDDGEVILMKIAQDGGKALHSVPSNARIGEYFRKRLGLQDGEFVKKEHLINYGNNRVTFTKQEDEQDGEIYFMDFKRGAGNH